MCIGFKKPFRLEITPDSKDSVWFGIFYRGKNYFFTEEKDRHKVS
jgi:hypothetical protein